MNSSRCNNCGLVNLSSDPSCRRCGNVLAGSGVVSHRPRSTREVASRGFPFFSTLIVLAAIAFLVYVYNEINNEMGHIQASDANRIATQPKQEPAGLSRTEYDRRRAGQYGNAIKTNPDIAAAQKRTEETEKLMAPTPAQSQKR